MQSQTIYGDERPCLMDAMAMYYHGCQTVRGYGCSLMLMFCVNVEVVYSLTLDIQRLLNDIRKQVEQKRLFLLHNDLPENMP